VEEIEALDAVLWAIAPDDPAKLAQLKSDQGLSFPILVDAELETIEAYGIVNEASGKVPHPTVVVVDKEGVVRFVHLDEDYRRRPSPETVVEALRRAVAAQGEEG